ncbi:MAG: homoserine kinase [Actinomycetota bacterium]|nr:homoserine kinase [Actinomycetota bacterium]
MPATVSVRVPATVANLGPGFDAVGVALDMHLEIDLETRRDTIDVGIEGEGAGHLPTDETNLVIRSMNEFFDRVARRPAGYALRVRNPIPLAAGLGSSAAAVVGGLEAARALTGRNIPQAEMIQLATEIEGHPDNVLAALVGGLVVCYRTVTGALGHYRTEVSPRLIPVLAVPRDGFPTRESRRVLPDQVPFSDAQHTAARAGLLVGALMTGGGTDVLAEAMADRLHQPHRLPLMPETAAVYEELRAAGLAVALAGAGPSLLLVVPRVEVTMRTEQIRRVCRARNAGWRVFVSDWEPKGARTTP